MSPRTDRCRARPPAATEPTTDPPAERRPAAPEPGPLELALDRVGDRWSFLVVEALLDGPRRFGELQAALPAIAPNILTDRLRRLERAAILQARPYQERPPRMAYELTGEGRDLASVLRLLADWGARTAPGDLAATELRHDACGTPLEVRWWCPTCATAIDGAAPTDLRHL